jgi:hypothetical protein
MFIVQIIEKKIIEEIQQALAQLLLLMEMIIVYSYQHEVQKKKKTNKYLEVLLNFL